MQENMVYVVGVDARNPVGAACSIVPGISAVVSSDRIFNEVSAHSQTVRNAAHIPVTPLHDAFCQVDALLNKGPVIFLASGDPLFFGIAKKCIERFGRERVIIHPAVSSIQHTFAAFTLPWEDTQFLSLHGRGDGFHLGEIVAHNKVALLTDLKNTPDNVCTSLLAFLGEKRSRAYTVYIAENIGMANERLVSGSLQKVAAQKFGGMCCMILNRKKVEDGFSMFGLKEEDVLHSRGLITKNEVRSAVLHTLDMSPGTVLWDVGAGSGSVGIEAARLVKNSLVYSIEKQLEHHENIEANIEKFSLYNLKLVKGSAPEALEGLPKPTRVFIGGSGGNLSDIILNCSRVLSSDGKIVVTAVIEKTAREAPQLLHEAGFDVMLSKVSVTRSIYPEKDKKKFNPITIIAGSKGMS